MSVEEEKTFVLKRVFTDVKKTENGTDLYGKEEKHFNIPWSILLYSSDYSSAVGMHLECSKFKGDIQWSIDTTVLVKVITNDGEKEFEEKRVFSRKDRHRFKHLGILDPLDDYLIDGNLSIECHVTINKMTGILKRKLKNFDDESTKKFTDVVLKVKDQKFHVCKMYLAAHSTYFESLFMGNFYESKQSEIELKDIEPEDFQKFMEVLYGEPDINEDTVEGILKLADMYDAKAAIRQCEKFLVNYTKRNLKKMFLLAIKYKLEDLKKKCMPEFKTSKDIASIVPEDPSQLDYAVWKELLKLSLDFNKRLAGK